MTTSSITPAQREQLRSHDLSNSTVRDALSGFLHQYFSHVFGAGVTGEAINTALVAYVLTVDARLDDAVELFNNGFRAPPEGG